MTDSTGYYSFGNLLLDEDFNGAGGPEPTHTISVVLAQPALAGLSQTLINAPGSTVYNDSNNPAGTSAQPIEGRPTSFANNNVTISSYDSAISRPWRSATRVARSELQRLAGRQ